MTTGGYGPTARLFHWITFLLVLGMVPAGLVMVQEGLDRSLQNQLFIFHKNVGVLVLVVVLARLAWRALTPPPQPPAMPAWQQATSAWVHRVLYGLLVFMALTGYLRVTLGGFPIETLDALGVPRPPRNDTLAAMAQRAHFLGKFALVGVIALHVLAATWHGLVKRDGVFSRMWPPLPRR